ncbi:MAG: glycosyltransferase family 2 protein [Candidatus Omnitrophica bacterium]|nr:glycosyltransferase family 2 protein [Candidatus Omnitrophota bacterium]
MISLIFPAFNEEGNIEVLYDKVKDAINSTNGLDFEFIFVDDCSSDNTPLILSRMHERDKRVKVIRFARNFGSHAALACGLNNCKGKAAIVMAADLQDPPQLIPQLIGEWQKGSKVVWGARNKREGESLLTKILAGFYYTLMNWLTTVKLPPRGADVFLVDKNVIDAFRQVTEKHTSVFMTIAWLGFKQSTIYYDKKERFSGKSKWSLKKKLKLTVDSLLSFSDVPVRYMAITGFLFAFLGFSYALFIFWLHANGSPVTGWSSLMVVILVVGGIQMMTLGVLGEYLWRTFDESRRRPRYVIEYKVE